MDGIPGGMKLFKDKEGRLGEMIATNLWPDIVMFPSGGKRDKAGTDAMLHGSSVQIKYDAKIAVTGNLYVEHFEKTVGCEGQDWRTSPSDADWYIFVTTNKAYRVKTSEIKKASEGKDVKEINSTSRGILIPINSIPITESKAHIDGYWQPEFMQQWEVDAGVWYDKDSNPNCGYRQSPAFQIPT